jgi:uncharacterized membrane protein/protein-disulfide isomerase
MSSRIRWAILALALAGLGFSLAASWVHYKLVTDPTYVSPCDVSSTLNCTQAYQSRFGTMGGVPTALAGVVWFGLVALVAGFARPTERASPAAGYLFALATIGMAVSFYLAYASFFVLGTGCLLCIGTYVCVLGIFGLVATTKTTPMTELPSRVAGDLRAGLGRPIALVVTIMFLAATVSAVAFFPKEEEAAARAAEAAAAAPAPTGDARQDFANVWFQQPRVDMGIPADGAKVVVVKFNDFECPSCRQYEVFYKPIFEKFEKSHPGAVKYVVKDFPWNSECNFNSQGTIPGHEAACDASVAARVAKERGKYQEMVDWIYANQGTSKAELRAAAQKILGPFDFDREVALKMPDLRRDAADGGALNVRSTPTYYVNGVLLPSGMRPEYFELAIALEIERAK